MSQLEHGSDEVQMQQWKPSLHQLAIMLSLAICSVMISLDATIIITTLSVSLAVILVLTLKLIVIRLWSQT
jgi:hypothetical protein